MNTGFQTVQEFSRRTGIKDSKVDTYLQMQDGGNPFANHARSISLPSWVHNTSTATNTTVGVVHGEPKIDYDTITFWHRKTEEQKKDREELFKRYFEGNWGPHREQEEAFKPEHRRFRHSSFDRTETWKNTEWIFYDDSNGEYLDAEYRVLDNLELPEHDSEQD